MAKVGRDTHTRVDKSSRKNYILVFVSFDSLRDLINRNRNNMTHSNKYIYFIALSK